jgi:microcystin-dependent protein
MATYTDINGVKLITTGDEAGTWGTSTNTNLQILERAANGYAQIALSGTTYTLTLSNQPSSPENGHYKAIEFTGSPGGTCTVTLEQNDHARVYMFLNSTDETVTITQGSGGNVSILASDGAIVLADGAGSGAQVKDLTATIQAETATKLATARDFSITGDITAAAVSFDGTGNVALSAAITADSIVDADINSSAAIADTKLATISTASKVANSATTATDANTASAIVARDGSGNFSAGTITATLTGNVTGDLTGNVTGDLTGNVTGDVTGNASTATTLETARTIAGQSFNGSANISIGPTDLTGVTASASDINTASTNYVPSGGIIMWSGAIAAIPTGWVLCDGNNSTPDLRDRFIVGAGSTYAVDATGGSSTVTLSEANLPSHSHGVGNIATSSAGAHTHNFSIFDSAETFTSLGTVGSFRSNSQTNFTTSSAGAHTHTMTGNTGSTGSGTAHENKPPYYALAYIMKT